MNNATVLKKPAADDGALHAKLSAWRNENAAAILQRVKDGLTVKLISHGTTFAHFSQPNVPKPADIVKALASYEGAAIRELDTRTMRETSCQGTTTWADYIATRQEADEAAQAAQVVPFPAAKGEPEPSESDAAKLAPEPKPQPAPRPPQPEVGVEEAETVMESEPAAPIPNPIEPLTHVPGVVGELVDWITATARRPNRVLALGAAITLVGTLIGRRVAGPTNSATHLYVLGLAPTSSGKQHPIDCLKKLMEAAKADHHLGPSEFISMPSVINFLRVKPLALCPQDEFGAFLKRINNRRASGFEAGISKVLREMWGLSFNRYDTPEWAGRASEPIKCPALSLYGLSTPSEFFESLQAGDLSNGFLNRFLVLSSTKRAPEMAPSFDPYSVPQNIVDDLRTLYCWREGELAAANLNNTNLNPRPDARPWASPAAESAYRDFSCCIEERIDQEPGLDHFVGRSAEMAVRLATIRAAGRWVGNYDFSVDLSDMQWGVDLASASGDLLATEAHERMTGDQMTYSQIFNKVIDTIKRKRRISRSDLLRALQKSVRSKELGDILRTLIESGTVATEQVTPPRGGPSATWYRFVR